MHEVWAGQRQYLQVVNIIIWYAVLVPVITFHYRAASMIHCYDVIFQQFDWLFLILTNGPSQTFLFYDGCGLGTRLGLTQVCPNLVGGAYT